MLSSLWIENLLVASFSRNLYQPQLWRPGHLVILPTPLARHFVFLSYSKHRWSLLKTYWLVQYFQSNSNQHYESPSDLWISFLPPWTLIQPLNLHSLDCLTDWIQAIYKDHLLFSFSCSDFSSLRLLSTVLSAWDCSQILVVLILSTGVRFF